MNETLITIAVLVALGVALVAPILLGRQLTMARPGWSAWLVTGLSALPTGLPFLAFAAWIAATSDISTCAEPPCGNMAPLWFQAMLFMGVIALLVGFGLAWIGRITARNSEGEAKT